MKVFFHEDFYQVYTSDPAAAKGRMEAVVKTIEPWVEMVSAEPADHDDVAAVHSPLHIRHVQDAGLYPIAILAAGGAVQAANQGLTEPGFGLIRPPGHHASADTSWGFCYFNNMAVAIESLKCEQKIETAYILDIDLHYGDGTVNILENQSYVTVHNVEAMNRDAYMREADDAMARCRSDIIAISAGFDNHLDDWGGVLATEDYYDIGKMVKAAADRNNGGCFAVLEGGYNHDVLGKNVLALIQGLSDAK
ncbi:MAG: histone deacetylase family protein [Thermodesulfobacteriota bacterium]|nr:histone deacetylase family protein [Thermodesulfobacteriota bacterium]